MKIGFLILIPVLTASLVLQIREQIKHARDLESASAAREEVMDDLFEQAESQSAIRKRIGKAREDRFMSDQPEELWQWIQLCLRSRESESSAMLKVCNREGTWDYHKVPVTAPIDAYAAYVSDFKEVHLFALVGLNLYSNDGKQFIRFEPRFEVWTVDSEGPQRLVGLLTATEEDDFVETPIPAGLWARKPGIPVHYWASFQKNVVDTRVYQQWK